MPTFSKALVNVYSADIIQAADFYGRVLGLDESYRFPRTGAPEHVEYRIGESTVAVSSPAGLASHGMPPMSPGHPFEIGLKVDDVDKLVMRLREAGVTIVREPFDSAAGNRVAYIADPDGNWISLYHNLPR